MTKMAVKRTGVVKKHCSAFVLFSKGVYPQTKFISIKVKERKTKGELQKIKTAKTGKITQSPAFFSLISITLQPQYLTHL